MAATQLNSTTLSAAIDNAQITFTLASTAGVAVGDLLCIRSTRGLEVGVVQSIPVSGTVNAKRGVSGTPAYQAASGTLVYTGAPSLFTSLYANAEALGMTGNPGTLPQWLLPGARATDGAGNEYVLLDLTFTAFKGVAVLIDRMGTFTAKALFVGDVGSVAILAEEGTSAQYVWGQIYGAFGAAQFTSGSSLATSTGVVQPATTASVPVGALLAQTTSLASSAVFARVLNLFITSAVTTATTAATSASGFVASVWLNYPSVENDITSA